jgi:hypothetical protein
MNKYPNKSLKSIDINVKIKDLVAKVLLNKEKIKTTELECPVVKCLIWYHKL